MSGRDIIVSKKIFKVEQKSDDKVYRVSPSLVNLDMYKPTLGFEDMAKVMQAVLTNNKTLKRSQEFLVSSDPALGATNVMNGGGQFSVQFPANIMQQIPENARNCQIGVINVTLYYTIINVGAGFNNNKFRFSTNAGVAYTTYTIPDGLYDLPAMATQINNLLVMAGNPTGLLSFGFVAATQMITITFNADHCAIDFTLANSINSLLGFAAAVTPVGADSTAGELVQGSTVAQFNTNNYFMVASTMCQTGIVIGNNSNQGVLCQVPITVAPGSQLIYQPQVVSLVDASNLRGGSSNSFIFTLTNQSGIIMNTNGDTWSVRFRVQWEQ